MEAIAITSLRQAVLLTSTHDGPCNVVVRSVSLEQSPALLEVLVKARRVPPGWVVARDQKLRHLARLANEITVILDVVLPMLEENPVDADGGRLLLRYGWSLSHISRKVDGPNGAFYTIVSEAGSLLRRHANHLRGGTRGVGWLRDNVDILRETVLDLKPVIANIPDGDDEGPDGGDEGPDGGDEGPDGGERPKDFGDEPGKA